MHEHEKLTEEERELEMICKEIDNPSAAFS